MTRSRRTGSASERDEDGIPKVVDKQVADLSEAASSHSDVDLNEAAAGNAEKSTSEKVTELLYMEAIRVIEGGDALEKMTIPQCKAYLRTHKLLLSGNKPVLLDRIREHLKIKTSGGHDLYPESSFAIDCTGDVCCGDIILFQQNVYDSYDIVARKSSGPPLGRRLVAGRVVKESYGVSKQQHTFTIEVLWSKGVNALAPLTTLLVKGRNLYRFKAFRQIWQNEEERKEILEEKHKRGEVARTIRATVRAKKSLSQSKHERRKRRVIEKASVRKEVFKDQDPEVQVIGSVPVLPETKSAAGEEVFYGKPFVEAPTRKRQRNDVDEELSRRGGKRKRTEQRNASNEKRVGTPCYSPTSGWQLPIKEVKLNKRHKHDCKEKLRHQSPHACNQRLDTPVIAETPSQPQKKKKKKKKNKSQEKPSEDPKRIYCQCRNPASFECVNRCCKSCCLEIANACHKHAK